MYTVSALKFSRELEFAKNLKLNLSDKFCALLI